MHLAELAILFFFWGKQKEEVVAIIKYYILTTHIHTQNKGELIFFQVIKLPSGNLKSTHYEFVLIKDFYNFGLLVDSVLWHK